MTDTKTGDILDQTPDVGVFFEHEPDSWLDAVRNASELFDERSVDYWLKEVEDLPLEAPAYKVGDLRTALVGSIMPGIMKLKDDLPIGPRRIGDSCYFTQHDMLNRANPNERLFYVMKDEGEFSFTTISQGHFDVLGLKHASFEDYMQLYEDIKSTVPRL